MENNELGKMYNEEGFREESTLSSENNVGGLCLNNVTQTTMNAAELYQYFADTASQGVSLSCSATSSEVAAWERNYQTPEAKLKRIKAYCNAVLADVSAVNEKASVAAFSTIPIFMGFLSNLCFHKNEDAEVHKGGDVSEKVSDNVAFRVYVRRFILGEKRTAAYGMLNNGYVGKQYKGFDWLLYKFIRCGLVHSQSLVNEKAEEDRRVSVEITHDESASVKSPEDIEVELNERAEGSAYQCVISAVKLIAWIKESIEKMFEEAKEDENLEKSIIEVFKVSTPVMKAGTLS